jgi:hypothetical protein
MNATVRLCLLLGAGCLLTLLAGCWSSHRVKVEPVEIKPIHITIDVNVRVERALDDFFTDLDEKSTTLNPTPPKPEEGEKK